MKKVLLIAIAMLVYPFSICAQQPTSHLPDEKAYQFTVEKEMKVTAVKNQSRTGTCWCFATVALLEAELIRMGKGEHILSEMYIVRNNFEKKADLYVRLHGRGNFSQGAISTNVFEIVKQYGIVPESAYKGLNYGETLHTHTELDAVTKAYVDAVIKGKKLTTAWKQGLSGILDAYLGKKPDSFTYNGNTYTPQSFSDYLGLNMDDYVSITSFTHHPFYTKFIMEIPDNPYHGYAYNVPLNELTQVIDNALDKGYTLCWDADVSEVGFQHSKGYAIVPEEAKVDQTGSDRARFEGPQKDDGAAKKNMTPAKEKAITQEMRQLAFDSYETTDDHLMLIMGRAKDQNGNTFYKVKNSWGTERNAFGGYLHASLPYIQYKTISVFVHKDALPAAIASKLGLK